MLDVARWQSFYYYYHHFTHEKIFLILKGRSFLIMEGYFSESLDRREGYNLKKKSVVKGVFLE